jgi:DNA modification methylase
VGYVEVTDVRAMVFSGKAEHLLSSLPENSVDSVITDPPYGLAPLKTATLTSSPP